MLKNRHKKGAAAFYIVAFSTLILVVIATSFAMVIMSEMTRTMNDDLAQSAYDSALAGVEDAKVAFANYQRCAEANFGSTECLRIRDIMANPSCNMVGRILYGDTVGSGEITVGNVTTGGTTENVTNQAYTCVKILTELSDYRSSLGSRTGKYVQTIRAGVKDGGTNTISKIKFSWYSVTGNNPVAWNSSVGSTGVFKSAISVPPTIELQIVQTKESFTLDQFDQTVGNQTNRATLYLNPSNTDGTNTIAASDVVKTNNRYQSNQPFVIKCDGTTGFWCSVEINLPEPIGGGARANDTFLISVSIPYQEPDTDFAVELICNSGNCGGESGTSVDSATGSNTIRLKNTQVAIESTGRANDLVRRVETRLETSDTSFGLGTQSPYYALMILGSGTVSKDMTVTYENKHGPFYF